MYHSRFSLNKEEFVYYKIFFYATRKQYYQKEPRAAFLETGSFLGGNPTKNVLKSTISLLRCAFMLFEPQFSRIATTQLETATRVVL